MLSLNDILLKCLSEIPIFPLFQEHKSMVTKDTRKS